MAEHDLLHLIAGPFKRSHDLGIKVCAAALVNDLHSAFHGETLFVAAAGHQGIEHDRHRHDA